MGITGFITEEKRYDPVDDIWTNSSGRIYIRNEFNPAIPIWVDISTPQWSVVYAGNTESIDWDSLNIPIGMLKPIHDVVKEKIKRVSPGYMSVVSCMLEQFQTTIIKSCNDFSDLSTTEMLEIFQKLIPSYRSLFRSLYKELATRRIGGARPDIAHEMRSWKSRSEVLLLREVLEWDPVAGALTSSEEEVLREILRMPASDNELTKRDATRLYGWLLLETLKRSSQILEISCDGLKCVPDSGHDEWFVEVRPIKYQTGMPKRWCHISDDLAKEIVSFSKRTEVAYLQNKYNRLIVWNAPSLLERGVLSSADGKQALMGFIYKRQAISPRTGKVLHVTPTRIRHTGATRLAFAGVSRDIIQEILEHDSPLSCQAYIDAIGSDIVPAIEKAGRLMGNIFFELNKSFFQGKVVPEVTGAPIVVPGYCTTPLIVGSCGRDPITDGGCKKHPFLSCYADCSSFRAWNNPEPHKKALRYFETQKSRCNPTGDPSITMSLSIPERKSLAVFDRAIESTKEILTQIQGELA